MSIRWVSAALAGALLCVAPAGAKVCLSRINPSPGSFKLPDLPLGLILCPHLLAASPTARCVSP